MKTTLCVLAALLLTAHAAGAAVLEGRIVNGTSGEAGTAELLELMDLTQGMTPMATLENVEGSFRFEDVPEQSAAHFLLRITSDGVRYSQGVQAGSLEEPIEVMVYESTTDRSQIRLSVQHVLFQRSGDHMMVTELLEFSNESSPPLTVGAQAGPMRMHLGQDIHGEIEASVGAGTMPIKLALLETNEPAVYTVDYPLRPGTTRVVLRYQMGYESGSLNYAPVAVYPTDDRRVLVSPDDVQVTVEDMILTPQTDLEGFAVYSGLAIEPGTQWSVAMAGGSAQAVDPRQEARGQQNASAVQEVRIRPNRIDGTRGWIIAGLALFLVGAMGYFAAQRPGGGKVAGPDPVREKLSRLSDRFVSGEINREEFERRRDEILGRRKVADGVPT